jgi:enoyl-CoA hydratase/carnithine racemase
MQQIESTISNGLMKVVFARPERKNALTEEMYGALGAALDAATCRPEVKVLLFAGAAGVFTAGNDLEDFISRPPQDADAPVFRFLRRLATFPKPAIAAVEGLAIGVGTTMLLHCDLVYAAEDAQFVLPFVSLGLVPEAASSVLLPRVAGYQRAAEKLLFGDSFPAGEAQAMGFVNRVLPPGEVLPFAIRQAERLALLPAGSVRGTKELMKAAGSQMPKDGRSLILQCMEREFELFTRRLAGPAVREAIGAFKEKRRPDFTDIE